MSVSLVPSSAELQFEAAHQAGLNDPFKTSTSTHMLNSSVTGLPQCLSVPQNHMIVSPYTTSRHLLDLRTLDIPCQLLTKSLAHLICTRQDYATAPYITSFNWPEIIGHLVHLTREQGHSWKEQEFYVVVFRSQILPQTVRAELGALDEAAHAEAMAGGGFLKYWFGTPDKNGRNLATCVWRSCHDARTCSVGKHHIRAATAARHSYSEWRIERLRLLIKDGVEGWEIGEWVD